ncbi:MAG: hypothetical protein LBC88_07825 [Spirochaetaceae bacterium]|nr:hypothetical protein [Spirochaetaceae bacterium]
MAPRIAGLFVLYAVVFTALVIVQFSNRRNFTRRAGQMIITVNYKTGGEISAPEFPAGAGTYPLNGAVSVSFGGMQFRLGNGEGFSLLTGDGTREPAEPVEMVIDGHSASFHFSAGGATGAPARPANTLTFTLPVNPAGTELRISGSFAEAYGGAEIPYRPLRSARVRDGGDGSFIIASDGMNFSFGRSRLDTGRRLVILEKGAAISYRTVQNEAVFEPRNYVLSAVQDAAAWSVLLGNWRDQIFASWGRTPTALLNSEELVTAYAAEAVHRGNYREVIARFPRSFLDGAARTWFSSAFLGGMTQALRGLTASERGRAERLAALREEDPAAFLAEPHIFAENYRRELPYADEADGLALQRALSAPDAALIPAELVPAVLEHWADFADGEAGPLPGGENPFEPWITSALDYIGAHILMDSGGRWALVFAEERAGLEYNFRLALALARYGRAANQGAWAALGRSIAFSVMSFTDASGGLPVLVDTAGQPVVAPGQDGSAGPERLSAARLYAALQAENWPRFEILDGPGAPIRVWTAADAITAAWNGTILDIAVTFPPGETHYLMVRNIRPFTRLQLYGVDYRTDPQFERYDSSGWTYNAVEQTLLLKMRHRANVEHIRIDYAPPPPRPAPAPPPPEETANRTESAPPAEPPPAAP